MPAKSRLWVTLRLFALCGALAASASASPIKYQLKVPNATVHIGAQTYANFPVTFTFVGDDANAVTGTVVIGGTSIIYSAIYQGVASVEVNSGPGGSLATAVFAPNQIVVSADHNNQGFGFGLVPGGIGPAGFDVTQLQPLYPAGVSIYAFFSGESLSNLYGYDLTLNYARNNTALNTAFHPDGSVDILAAVYVCDQFNGSIYFMNCAFPPDAIQTDRGRLASTRFLNQLSSVRPIHSTSANSPRRPSVPCSCPFLRSRPTQRSATGSRAGLNCGADSCWAPEATESIP
jgi:hypothetical protein